MSDGKKETLVRTSVQLHPDMVAMLDKRWPGLSRSEALRLSLERFAYCDSPSEECAQTIEKHGAELEEALAGFGYADFRAVARALPALVEGYLRDEARLEDSVISRLENELDNLDRHNRIYLLDQIVLRRQRGE